MGLHVYRPLSERSVSMVLHNYSLPPSLLAGSFSLHEPLSLHNIAPGSPPSSVQSLPDHGAETPPRHERFRNCEF